MSELPDAERFRTDGSALFAYDADCRATRNGQRERSVYVELVTRTHYSSLCALRQVDAKGYTD